MPVATCRIVDVPVHRDARGALTVLEAPTSCPFPVQRVFTLFDLAPDAQRGGHAHIECHELVQVVRGAATVVVSDPTGEARFALEGPERALHLAPMSWLDIVDIQPGTVIVVACSHGYDEADYLRDPAAYAAAFQEL